MTIKERQPNKGKRVGLRESEIRPKPINYNQERPIFCLRYVDPEYCILNCDKDDKAAFAERIRQLSTLTWNQIIQADRHGFGREKIDATRLRRPAPRHITEDVTFFALRFSGLKPMVGYQTDATYHIIWFDRDCTLYDHG